MKRLTFLLRSNSNELANGLIDYVVDSGHFIDVICTKDHVEWLSKYTYNVKVINAPDVLKYSMYDYIIDLSKHRPSTSYDIAQIRFYDLIIKDHVLSCAIYLVNKDGLRFLLSTVHCPFDSYNLNHTYQIISEKLIDALIFLARNDANTLCFSKYKKGTEGLDILLNFDEKIKKLKSLYINNESGSDTIFHLKISGGKVTQRSYKHYACSKLQLNTQYVELLTLYLLMLLNARNGATYKYDLITSNHCAVTKYIDILPQDSYNTIIKKFNNVTYEIRHKQFFAAFLQSQPQSEIMLQIHDGNRLHNNSSYMLEVEYNRLENTLKIHYLSELYFFDEVALYINYFCNQVGYWSKNAVPIAKVLCTDITLYNKQLYTWNSNHKPQSLSRAPIHVLFEEQSLKNPDSVAIVTGNTFLTYNELNNLSNRLSNYLIDEHLVKPEDHIALCLDRNEWIVIAIIAVLKSGGTYIPLDPDYPNESILYRLQDSAPKLILTNSEFETKLFQLDSAFSSRVIAIDRSLFQIKLNKYSSGNPGISVNPRSLAYIIYTSGTTGKPKGVMIEHDSVVNHAYNIIHKANVTAGDVILQFSPLVFDAFVEQFSMALFTGSTLVIPSKSELLNNASKIIRKYKITHLDAVPAFLSELELDDYSFKCVISGGDRCDLSLVNKYNNLINDYGPTETTISAVQYCVTDPGYLNGLSSVPIGRPITNITCYILDQQQQPLPIGVIGELYIGGAGLARGYLNQPELTLERFIPNPFQTTEERQDGKNARLYKTGDLVRYLPDGNIEYIGRNDCQVKIRGYRIELGEIESNLLNYPEIKQAVVLDKETSSHNSSELPTARNINKYLVGYYVSDKELNNDSILSYLSAHLPDYMVPSVLVYLERLPLTINGKLDRKALPDPKFINMDSYIAPRSELEYKVCTIYAEVLGLPVNHVGIYDDFFRLGGNSILAIKLASKINNYFESHIKIATIFSSRCIANLTQIIVEYSNEKYHGIIRLNRTSDKPTMFMIHPGHAGCEVYHDIASRMEQHYSCYGIDNYNIHNLERLNTIEDVAIKYLAYIETVQTDGIYNLLGWSFGGQIALQIAGMLELKGHAVNLYLLDTFMFEHEGKMPGHAKDMKSFIHQATTRLINRGIDTEYLEKVKASLLNEYSILTSGITIPPKLNSTKIKLFKAMNEAGAIQYSANNLEIFVSIPFEVIELACDHYEILDFIITHPKLMQHFNMMKADLTVGA